MSSFQKVNGKYRTKSQGRGAVPVPPVAWGSTLTTKSFLLLLWLINTNLLISCSRSQWRKGRELQPELQAGGCGFGGNCWCGSPQAPLMLGRCAELLGGVRPAPRCSYRRSLEKQEIQISQVQPMQGNILVPRQKSPGSRLIARQNKPEQSNSLM